MNILKKDVDRYDVLLKDIRDIDEFISLGKDENDNELETDIYNSIGKLEKQIRDIRFTMMFSGKHDISNAILSMHPGAGGTESQDWAEMLLRMYMRWGERKGYKTSLLDKQAGDEAGIKSATVLFEGDFAYGFLRSEIGVHRLVRISPFDANKRRHTSFAAVEVLPEIDDNIEIEIKPDDLKVDTFRSSGAGGQHVNVTDSAIRITHIPTGIVVQCQNERSQHKNRSSAMKVLKSRLYDQKLKEQGEEVNKLRGKKSAIEWGSQIRSYVFQPYTLVKDHRTNVEKGNGHAVMDGELDDFMTAFLTHNIQNTSS